jgi:hypothetical protein
MRKAVLDGIANPDCKRITISYWPSQLYLVNAYRKLLEGHGFTVRKVSKQDRIVATRLPK